MYNPFDIVNHDKARLNNIIDFHGGLSKDEAEKVYRK